MAHFRVKLCWMACRSFNSRQFRRAPLCWYPISPILEAFDWPHFVKKTLTLNLTLDGMYICKSDHSYNDDLALSSNGGEEVKCEFHSRIQ